MEPKKGRILLVEGHPDTCTILKFMLEMDGYTVTPVSTLAEALETDQHQQFDLYLLNHVFPDGSGLTLCRQLRERYPETPIIFFSARALEAEVQAGFEAGANAYLVQPEDIVNVTQTVDRLLGYQGEDKTYKPSRE